MVVNAANTARLRIALAIATATVPLLGCTSDTTDSRAHGGNASGNAGARATTGATTVGNTSSGATMGSQAGVSSSGGAVAATGSAIGNGGGTLATTLTITGGNSAKGGAAALGGSGNGGNSAKGGTTASGGSSTGTVQASACSASNLVWKTANKTNYTSYPDPGSEECIKYNGCTWAGQFAACDATKTEAWVSAHNIVAAFPNFQALKLHDLCLRKGSKTILVTVLDTCGDSDCDGCCTENRGNADELIDIESYTNARWGVPDGPIEWTDLGPTKGVGCD